MAGIGFELRKLFDENDSFSGYIKALTFSTFISVGPFVSTVIAINILIISAREIFNNSPEQLLFISTLVYSFIFSQIITYPFHFLVTRYISDRFYKKEYNMVKPALIGNSKIIVIISTIVGLLFVWNKELPLYYKYLSVGILITLSLLWTVTAYISILKNYVYISKIYVYSNLLSVIVFVITLKYPIMFKEYRLTGNMLFSFFIGIIFSYYMLVRYFLSIFRESKGGQYEFLGYLKNYSKLVYIGIFYILGTWSHIIILWFSPLSTNIGHGFKVTINYENAIFYSFLLTIPSIVFFVVFIETRFFDIYQKYYALTLKSGTLKEIDTEKRKMRKSLYKEIYYALQVQIFITLTAILFTRYLIIYHNLSVELVDIFKIVSLGAIANVYIVIIISIFFYFNQLKSAYKVTGIFFILNTGLTIFFLKFGKAYLGLGYFLGSIIALLYALTLFDNIIDNLNYQTFFSQNFALEKRSKVYNIVIDKLNKSGNIKLNRTTVKLGLVISIVLLIILSYIILK